MPADILVVRHGAGRGRIPLYGQHILDWLRVQRPDLARRIRVHETGAPPPELNNARAVFFWLADPLEVQYPRCFDEALSIENEALRRSLVVLNRPSVLATYSKEYQSRRFGDAGIPSPEAIRIAGTSDLLDCADRLGLPLIIRGSQSFSQEKTLVVRTHRRLKTLQEQELPEMPVATRLVDVRGFRPRSSRRLLWARCYHRKRVILIGNRCVPHSLFFSRDPVVSQETSIYSDYLDWRSRMRRYGPVGRRAPRVLRRTLGVSSALALEREFVEFPVQHEAVFKKAGVALGLEFAAFDYGTLPSGSVLIWEANPYPFLSDSTGVIMRQSRGTANSMLRLYEAFASLFEHLASDTSGLRPHPVPPSDSSRT